MMFPNGCIMTEKTRKGGLRLKAGAGAGAPAGPQAARTDLVRFPTQTSAVRSLLGGAAEAGERKLRLTTRLLEPLPAASEGRPPSTDARRVLRDRVRTPTQAAPDGSPSPRPSAQNPTAGTSVPQLAAAVVDDPDGLGRLVRVRRQILQLTQQEASDAAGVGRRFISELEAGKPTVELAKVLAVFRTLGLLMVVRQADG